MSLATQKQKLDILQRQKPPSKQEDLVQYLLKRLEAAETSIKVADEVIKSERQLRQSTSKQMKSEITQLNSQVEEEKTNLSQKVTAELDFTLKKAVKEKLQIKKDMEVSLEANAKLQKDFDNL
jgi:DNA-binding transcriptional MerR regulator